MTTDTELQFDQVERPATQACSACQSAFRGSYFQANGHLLCEACADKIRNSYQEKSGGFVRFLKASFLGIGGGLLGSAVYTAVLAITHINAALITILIGWLVGKGVRKGNGDRGGRGYQILAVLITYLAFGFSMSLSELLTTELAEGSIVQGIVICVIGTFIGGALMATSDLLGAIIAFFGLLQAWKSNAAATVEITGPHFLNSTPETIDGGTPPPLPTTLTSPVAQGA